MNISTTVAKYVPQEVIIAHLRILMAEAREPVDSSDISVEWDIEAGYKTNVYVRNRHVLTLGMNDGIQEVRRKIEGLFYNLEGVLIWNGGAS